MGHKISDEFEELLKRSHALNDEWAVRPHHDIDSTQKGPQRWSCDGVVVIRRCYRRPIGRGMVKNVERVEPLLEWHDSWKNSKIGLSEAAAQLLSFVGDHCAVLLEGLRALEKDPLR